MTSAKPQEHSRSHSMTTATSYVLSQCAETMPNIVTVVSSEFTNGDRRQKAWQTDGGDY